MALFSFSFTDYLAPVSWHRVHSPYTRHGGMMLYHIEDFKWLALTVAIIVTQMIKQHDVSLSCHRFISPMIPQHCLHDRTWTIWTSLSTVPRKALKFNHSLTHSMIGLDISTVDPPYNAQVTYSLQPVCSGHTATLILINVWQPHGFNKLSQRQNGRKFPDDIFKCIFLNENM